VPDLELLSDADLVAHARSVLAVDGGKPIADRCIAIVFERHASLVRAVLGAKMPSARIDDAAQIVWQRFWTKIATDAEVIRSPAGLLVRISRYVRADVAAAGESTGLPLDDAEAGVADATAGVELEDFVSRLLDELPARQRQVVVLRMLEDRPSAEVARILGTTPGNIDVILHRALDAMRRAAT
jgi:RNA polymerase sigma-70 factor, ECF subfamily